MQFWNELEGQVIEGYPLRRLVRSEGRTAWFDTTGSDNQPATISLTESLTDADEVTQRLEAAQQLKNPNLIAISKVGRTRIGETLVVYAIMEHADQDLSDVLRNHALPREEVRQVAEAMVDGLTAIHQRGLVHGRVEASSILAVGETVKLRSDCLQSPGGTRAGDVAGIGATLFQAFTQRKTPAADDAQINRLPAPFAEIVRNSLSARWGLAQIASVLKPATAPNSAAASPGSPASAARPVAAASVNATPLRTPPTERPTSQPVPPAFTPAAVAPARTALVDKIDRADEDLDSPRRQPVALYATVGIAVLLLLAWFLFRPKAQQPAPASPMVAGRSAVPDTATPAAPPPATPTTDAPEEASPSPAAPVKPAPAKPAAAMQSAAPGSSRRSVWRVVAYTYNRQDQAQQKVDEINHAHPELAASVFSPGSAHGQYLVTLGGPMDRDQAFKLRAQAISSGLPNDSYAQNFWR